MKSRLLAVLTAVGVLLSLLFSLSPHLSFLSFLPSWQEIYECFGLREERHEDKLKITVLDESGNVLDTYNRELYGNELEYELKMSTKTGRTLQLVIELQDAYLYAIGGR